MAFVPDNHPQSLALLAGVLDSESNAERGSKEADPAEIEDANAAWLALSDWLEEHDDPRATLLRMAVAGQPIQDWLEGGHVAEWFGRLPRGVKVGVANSLPCLSLSLSPAAKVSPALANAVSAGWLTLSECNIALHLAQFPGLRRLAISSKPQDADFAALVDHPTLEVLSVRNAHSMTGAGYPHLGRCPQLARLSIERGTTLTDAAVAAWAGATQLRALRLSGCHNVNGSGIAALKSLHALHIETCDSISPDGVVRWRSLDQLEHLEWRGRRVSNRVVGAVPELPRLRRLDLKGVRMLRDDGLRCLRGFPQLERLNLSRCWRVTGSGLSSLAQPENSRALHLHGYDATTEVLAVLRSCTGLTDFTMQYARQWTDASLVHLSQAEELRSLELSRTGIVGTGLAALKTRVLEKLALESGACTDAGLAPLARFATLRELNLSDCQGIVGVGFEHLAKLANLERLHLRHCEKLDPNQFEPLAELANLNYLDLSIGTCAGDVALASVGKLPRLRHLKLTRSNALGDAGLAHLASLHSLTSLDLSNCSGFTDAGLAHLTGLSGLRELRLSDSQGFTDVGLAHLSRMTQLETLLLPNASNMTAAGFNVLQKLRNLRSLKFTHGDVFNREALDREALDRLIDLPHLRFIGGLYRSLSWQEFKQLQKLHPRITFTMS